MKGKTIQVPSTGPAFSLPPPQPKSEPSMVNMGISEQVFGNLFATLQQSGAFNQNIGSQQVSGGRGLLLSPANQVHLRPAKRQSWAERKVPSPGPGLGSSWVGPLVRGGARGMRLLAVWPPLGWGGERGCLLERGSCPWREVCRVVLALP